jgi:hypothetical protein
MRDKCLFLVMLALLSAPTVCLAGELEGQGGCRPVSGYLNISHLKPGEMNERVMCSVIAAVKYDVPANIILAVAEIEGGKPGQFVENTNGTYDVGTMQFNTAYLQNLAQYGITSKDVAASGCYSYELAAWRLRGHIVNDTGDLWTRAANYHSKTPYYNSLYRAKLIRSAGKWGDWLAERFNTRDMLAGNSPKQNKSCISPGPELPEGDCKTIP